MSPTYSQTLWPEAAMLVSPLTIASTVLKTLQPVAMLCARYICHCTTLVVSTCMHRRLHIYFCSGQFRVTFKCREHQQRQTEVWSQGKEGKCKLLHHKTAPGTHWTPQIEDVQLCKSIQRRNLLFMQIGQQFPKAAPHLLSSFFTGTLSLFFFFEYSYTMRVLEENV